MDTLPWELYNLKPVDLETLREVLEKSLKKHFGSVEVTVTQCPNLRESPFHLADEGIGGGETSIVDLGGVPYLIPLVDRKRVYDLVSVIPKYVGKENYPNGWYISGACAGAWPAEGSNCEMIANIKVNPDGKLIENKSKVALTSSGDEKDVVLKNLTNESRCAMLANLTVSSGTGKVLEIKCSRRIDLNTNFTSSIRESLKEEFGADPVGLGGLFFVRKSTTKIHIMRDFSTTPLQSDDDVNNWLKFFSMDPPMLFQSVVISSDPGLDLRLEHSHGWSLNEAKEEGGHYHYDLMPEDVEYHGYYAVAQKLYRIDRPVETHQIGRD